MNSRLGVTATVDMVVLLSELEDLPSGFLLVEHTARRGRSPLPSGLEALRAGSGDGVEPEAGCPRVSHPATYPSGASRLRFWLSDFCLLYGLATAVHEISGLDVSP